METTIAQRVAARWLQAARLKNFLRKDFDNAVGGIDGLIKRI